jgi:hypothetical protein
VNLKKDSFAPKTEISNGQLCSAVVLHHSLCGFGSGSREPIRSAPPVLQGLSSRYDDGSHVMTMDLTVRGRAFRTPERGTRRFRAIRPVPSRPMIELLGDSSGSIRLQWRKRKSAAGRKALRRFILPTTPDRMELRGPSGLGGRHGGRIAGRHLPASARTCDLCLRRIDGGVPYAANFA